MTQEEKAIDVVKQMIADGQVSREVAEKYFPELAEHDGEEIRKAIIDCVKKFGPENANPKLHRDMIAWLEKQDEQEDQQKLFDIAKHQGYKEGLRDGRAEVWAQIEKQGEQKQDPCEHCEDKCLNCHNFPCIKKKAFEQGKSVFEISNENPTIVQTTVVQSIEPKFKVGDTIKCTYDNRQFTIKSVDIEKGVYTYTEDGCSNDIDYVDEEFELVKHKPVEWSEDDEEMFDAIIADIQFTQKAHNHEVNQGIYEREMDWLKSLKERSVPQPKQDSV